MLLALSVSGNDANLLAATEAAHERDMTVIVLSGRTGGRLAAVLRETDVLINVPHDRAARVREVHALVLHCISDGVDAHHLVTRRFLDEADLEPHPLFFAGRRCAGCRPVGLRPWWWAAPWWAP